MTIPSRITLQYFSVFRLASSRCKALQGDDFSHRYTLRFPSNLPETWQSRRALRDQRNELRETAQDKPVEQKVKKMPPAECSHFHKTKISISNNLREIPFKNPLRISLSLDFREQRHRLFSPLSPPLLPHRGFSSKAARRSTIENSLDPCRQAIR